MRSDKIASQRQRLRRQADAFEFNALIQGVSTIEESEEASAPEQASEITNNVPKAEKTPEAIVHREPEIQAEPAALAAAEVFSEAPTITAPVLVETPEERLHTALEALGMRLLQEVSKMRVAMRAYDAQEAGFFLAHVNQLLELLHSVDPNGDIARHYRTTACPPEGRSWFPTAWSLAELAESPFSALLPPDADDEFAREMIYAAWGVEFYQNGV